jgi:hypothetical protein
MSAINLLFLLLWVLWVQEIWANCAAIHVGCNNMIILTKQLALE